MQSGKLFRIIKEILYFTGHIFFPGNCIVCGTELLFCGSREFPVCKECKDKLVPLCAQKRCVVCSLPLISEQEICTRCRVLKYHFHSHFTLFIYSGLIKELIYQYKFKSLRQLGYLWAEYLGPLILRNYPHAIVVPVPASPLGKRKRGWDHMDVIAGIIQKRQKEAGIKVVRCLSRKKSKEQKALDFEMRIINLKGKVFCPVPQLVAGKEVLLLDDIFTTGATVSECARILLEAGAARVDVLTIAMD